MFIDAEKLKGDVDMILRVMWKSILLKIISF